MVVKRLTKKTLGEIVLSKPKRCQRVVKEFISFVLSKAHGKFVYSGSYGTDYDYRISKNEADAFVDALFFERLDNKDSRVFTFKIMQHDRLSEHSIVIDSSRPEERIELKNFVEVARLVLLIQGRLDKKVSDKKLSSKKKRGRQRF